MRASMPLQVALNLTEGCGLHENCNDALSFVAPSRAPGRGFLSNAGLQAAQEPLGLTVDLGNHALRSRSRPILMSFLGDDPEEPKVEKHMTIDQAVLPSSAALTDLNAKCRLNLAESQFGGTQEGGSVRADGIGPAIEKASKCSKAASDVVISRTFGKLLQAPEEGSKITGGGSGSDKDAGVRLSGSLEAPLGTSYRESLQGAQDACHDYGEVLMHRLSHKNAALTSRDAHRVTGAFGRCLEGMGEVTELAACQLGNLKTAGGDSAEFCKEALGAEHHEACTIS
eukprot:TRINITY_DN9878_c1_g1_i2.p1 TRINITY_DN9878_c1_g1~~TRINITY_DN9878_c1_g1_i2.p1  ORF type:complete len:284 (-),score=51.60 TRINITY_DN9878_c1_g1_i2:120-971(-)